MTDNFKHKGLRKQLVEQIGRKGIKDKRILAAIEKIPRHLFVENYLENRAYDDYPLPINAGQTISQPYTVALQTELLEIEKGDLVLEIGTGSGYQTAVLLELGAKVFTIERQHALYSTVKTFLPKLGYKPQFFFGDGYLGKPTYGPYDKILITAGASALPEELLKQLKVGGILVAPIGGRQHQVMTTVEKTGEDNFTKNEHGLFVFVPMLKGVEHK